ncbi:copper-binding protein [Iodobacter sp. CM08]|uniref:copper-binding protein n=1 Tax=Iodobacter sp. CM08 TaxID=3085902 RepID=UPI002981104C|nr:copper-binding protein [Iodobacter sp. CM08]MDW5417265.1 copper-binding protein [Iodobacter sp. CM08]
MKSTRLIAVLAMAFALNTSFANSDELSDGEIKKIDKSSGKITLKHGELKNLDMPSMTMVFTAKNLTQLEPLQAGDKVKFKAVSENGKLVVTDIQAAK